MPGRGTPRGGPGSRRPSSILRPPYRSSYLAVSKRGGGRGRKGRGRKPREICLYDSLLVVNFILTPDNHIYIHASTYLFQTLVVSTNYSYQILRYRFFMYTLLKALRTLIRNCTLVQSQSAPSSIIIVGEKAKPQSLFVIVC